MTSAFGVDHGEISKESPAKREKRKNDTTGAAIAGAGAVTATTGLAAGGVPGAKSDFSSVFRTKPAQGKGVKRAVTTVTGKAPAAKAAPGGILGFRVSAHEGGNYGFREQHRKTFGQRPKSNSEAFFEGRNAGKIPEETKIIRHMKGGKKAAAAALVGGTGAMAYGAHKTNRDPVKKNQSRTDKYHGAMAGAGAAGLGVSAGAGKLLSSQGKSWERKASKSVDEAGKLVPAIAGREGKRMSLKQMHKYKQKNPGKDWPKSMNPSVTDRQIKSNPDLLKGVSTKAARDAGALRGAAAQQRHFAEVYNSTAKTVKTLRAPSAVVAAAGAGGIMASRNKKQNVSKAKPLMSDAEIRRRKKAQGHISQTTSTLGLAGITMLGASAAAKRGKLTKVPGLKNVAPEKLKDAATNTSVAAGGVGGIGGYNFAAYTNAESRKRSTAPRPVVARKAPVKKSHTAFGTADFVD